MTVGEMLVRPAPRDDAWASTIPGQRRDWRDQQRSEDVSFLHLSAAFAITGRLDPGTLAQAIDDLVARHAALRSRFGEASGTLMHVVEPETWSRRPQLAVAETDTRVTRDAWLRSMIGEPFELTSGAPFRAGLFIESELSATLVLVFHHIVADQLSVGVVTRDLGELLAAAIERRPPRLPGLRAEFADYAAWWNDKLSGGRFEPHLAYWAEQLDGAPVAVQLPVRSSGSSQALVEVVPLPDSLLGDVRRCAVRLRTTPYVVLLTAFSAALRHTTGHHDYVFGCGYANRQRAGFRDVVGRFSHNMGLRVNATGAPLARLRATHDVAMHGYSNAVISLDALIEDGRLRKEYVNAKPMSDLAFQLIHAVGDRLTVPGLEIEELHLAPASAQETLNVAVGTSGDRATLRITHRANELEPAWVASLSPAFLHEVDRLLALGSSHTPS